MVDSTTVVTGLAVVVEPLVTEVEEIGDGSVDELSVLALSHPPTRRANTRSHTGTAAAPPFRTGIDLDLT